MHIIKTPLVEHGCSLPLMPQLFQGSPPAVSRMTLISLSL